MEIKASIGDKISDRTAGQQSTPPSESDLQERYNWAIRKIFRQGREVIGTKVRTLDRSEWARSRVRCNFLPVFVDRVLDLTSSPLAHRFITVFGRRGNGTGRAK